MPNYVTTSEFKKIKHDSNGNPRYVLHFTWLGQLGEDISYSEALARSRPFGGKKCRLKAYGGGIVFSSFALWEEVAKPINDMLDKRERGNA